MALPPEFIKVGSDIIGSAFEVRQSAHRGLRESYYRDALAWELQQRGYDAQTEALIPALYKNISISKALQADIVIDNSVVIETKAIAIMSDREVRQLITYLKLSGMRLGYLINFGAKNFAIGKLSDQFPYDKGIYRIANGI